jgi:TPR repeat protein
MTILKRFTTLVITLSICVGAVWAGDVEDADAALQKKDYVTALKKYKSAAVKNDAYAQVQVGNFYNSNSYGVVQDYAEAVRWYKLAAAQGDAKAQYNLALMYDNAQALVSPAPQATQQAKRCL